jgi:cyanophycin synthetase
MHILELRPLRGPNIFRLRPVIYMKLDIEDYEEKPTNTLPGFKEALETLIPTLYEHRCSEGREGGFLSRVSEGTWLGHVVEHVALELQCLATMNVEFGRTRSTKDKGVYNVVFAYEVEEAGLEAGRVAVSLVEALAAGLPFELTPCIERLKEIREEFMLGPSTRSIVDEAVSRGIPTIRLDRHSLVQLGYGAHQKRIQATISSHTSSIAVDIACDKELTKNLLSNVGIPVPRGYVAETSEEALERGRLLTFPVVVKPINASKGRGMSVNVRSEKSLKKAFEKAQKLSRKVIIEEYIEGNDYRILIINGNFVAASNRMPAHVIGDGKSTIRQLVDEVNSDPRRGFGHENILTKIVIDEMSKVVLSSLGYTPESILEKGKLVYLKTTANLSTGGTATDVTDIVHPSNRTLAERAARVVGLDIAGIDIIAPSIEKPITETGGAIVEVNAAPGFRMHLKPMEGKERNVGKYVVDMLFPPGATSRIPIISVTGTNGKTTTVRLISHALRTIGKRVGFTTTEGIYIGNELIMKGDMTGPFSTRAILRDPSVDFAVLEIARGGILREGLGYDFSDVGIVLNVTEDHIGLKGIETAEEMANVKSLVVEMVREGGHAVLNADDPLVADMSGKIDARIFYFSLNKDNPLIQRHRQKGGVCVVFDGKVLTIFKGDVVIPVIEAVEIPIALEGKALFNVQNCLAAIAALYAMDVNINDIVSGLVTFHPTYHQNPGRLNLMNVGHFRVILDYAHNVASYDAIMDMLDKIKAREKIGIIATPGDRRDIDIERMGSRAARTLTKIIVREDDDRRGREVGEVADILTRAALKEGFDPSNIQTICDEGEAALFALKSAKPGDIVIMLLDKVELVYRLILKYKEEVDGTGILRKDSDS